MEIDGRIASKLTPQARQALRRAAEEARRLGHDFVGTEHILLGLAREGAGLGGQVLVGLGVDLRVLRLEVEKLVRAGKTPVPAGKLPPTPLAQRALESALQEAQGVNAAHVGTEYLLLGLLREREGVAAQVLLGLGVGLNQVRGAIGLLTAVEDGDGATAYDAFTGQARR